MTPRPSQAQDTSRRSSRSRTRAPRADGSREDSKARFAEALLIVSAYDTRAALVVCDQLPDDRPTPFTLDGESILRRADVLEREIPLP
jgi:hypothetical protein